MNLRKIKKVLKKKQDEGKVLGIGWYLEEQWKLLLENSEDRKNLLPTHAEWQLNAAEQFARMKKAGYTPKKIPIDVVEMIKWCEENGLPCNGETRSKYILLKTQEKFC